MLDFLYEILIILLTVSIEIGYVVLAFTMLVFFKRRLLAPDLLDPLPDERRF